jgi:hypothetical protein
MIRSLMLAALLTVGIGLDAADASMKGQRKGFTAALGGGAGLHREPGSNTGGFATNFEFGWGVTDRFSASWMVRGLIVRKGGVTTASDFSGLGITVHLKPQAPSAFLNLGMGSANLYTLSGKIRQRSGWGIAAGAGSEFRKHWNLGMNGEWGRIGGMDFYNVIVTIGHHWY